MGNILPSKAIDKVVFFENHNATWQTVATSIGTTAPAVTALTTKTVAARAAFNAQQLAQDQAKVATQAYHDAVLAMATAGTEILKAIKAKAAVDGNTVYNLAMIPVPATPTPVPPPGMPEAFVATLNPNGSLKLTWKCANPAGSVGTVYQISRRAGATPSDGPFVPVGVSGTKLFTDASVPSGVASVTYEIVAVRSTAVGVANQFIVNFGTGAAGEVTASVVAAAPKLAA